ncbi:LuxR C-terminal-related transcriptional regulator [Cohnella hashimotonis]|uniref:LuxR C-terminal-related transcriptional regulator n=1 Tax=Cohnella hashimotonis TaxID=2826895 RepID=A0ABT6TUJ9_9BACL|nr:LuxR C-terminal-related transcriptional regulator [Cohnella hashimotonis]MDI4649599.1 LuxR C-terminal-related transcriptional regulator [Cohnella hashimotonis]
MIVRTKLYIPHMRHEVVARPRLTRKLNEGMQVKLTHISAQAGYGKTTALGQWAKQGDALVAWLSLDARDNDYIQFWNGVTASIQEVVPGFGEEICSFLEKGLGASRAYAVPSLLNDLDRITNELAVVLDDYHFIESAFIHDSLAYLLEHLPSHVHLYIASRNELAIPTARLRAKGEFNLITMKDMRFLLDEGHVFFRNMTDLGLTSEQVAELLHQTEGWISGLELAAISLRNSDNIAESIRQFNGRQHHISDYLLEEVFRHLTEDMRSFLLATSILSRMNDSLCQAVAGRPDSQRYLERLEQLNLFIIPLDDQRSWYRYHHLFSDFLQRMGARTDTNDWVQAHGNAACWLERNGLDEDAMEHYLAGHHYADAVRLIEKNLDALVQSESIAFIRWMRAIPESFFAEKPLVELFYITVLSGIGDHEAASLRIGQARARFQALKDKLNEPEWKQAMGNIYFFSAVDAFLIKDLVKTSEYYERCERYMPEGSVFQTMWRYQYVGYDPFTDFLAHINDLHAAEVFLSRWVDALGNKTQYPLAGTFLAAYSRLLYEWDRLEEAERYANLALGRRDVRPYVRIFIQVATSASWIQQALGLPDRASELLEDLKSQLDAPEYRLFILKIEAEQACLALRQGAVEEALAWLQGCGLSHTDEVALLQVQVYMAYAKVLSAGGQWEEALDLLDRLDALLRREDRLRDRIKVLIMQSVTLQRMSRAAEALAKLETVLRLAEPEGYIRSFVDEGEEMELLLSAYGKTRPAVFVRDTAGDVWAYAKRLLQVMQSAPEPMRSVLTEQETKVLQLIADGLPNKEIALRLNITGETVKTHIKSVYRKLEVNNRVRAVQRARELSILG